MKTHRSHMRPLIRTILLTTSLLFVALLLFGLMPAPGHAANSNAPAAQSALQYVLIGWNDLGMHCMNLVFQNLAVLPPFNTLWAQVVVRGSPPQVATNGVAVSYSIRNNTYSVGKTDFWTYAKPLFSADLQPNIGLAGKGLAGNMDPAAAPGAPAGSAPDHFVAVGIPLTPFLDNDLNTLYPYNLADLAVTDTGGMTLTTTSAVAPVSTEMHCEYCHADGKEPGGSTGNVETNILTLHDSSEGTTLMSQRPVLCAACHGSNALGMQGNPNLPNLSRAMHSQHSETLYAGPGTFPVCYNCHPGAQTQCLRDVMYQHGLTCTDCHGSMTQVANPNRRPWIDVPRCGTCHTSQYAENTGKRYRDSIGHGGLYCEACHNSTHAIVPTLQYNDNLQNLALQGKAGTLGKCTVCHLTTPTAAGPHGLYVPRPPALRIPPNGAKVLIHRPTLAWYPVTIATAYRVEVHMGSTTGQIVAKTATTATSYVTPWLPGVGTIYFWRVQACKQKLCGDWSKFRSFTVATPR